MQSRRSLYNFFASLIRWLRLDLYIHRAAFHNDAIGRQILFAAHRIQQLNAQRKICPAFHRARANLKTRAMQRALNHFAADDFAQVERREGVRAESLRRIESVFQMIQNDKAVGQRERFFRADR